MFVHTDAMQDIRVKQTHEEEEFKKINGTTPVPTPCGLLKQDSPRWREQGINGVRAHLALCLRTLQVKVIGQLAEGKLCSTCSLIKK